MLLRPRAIDLKIIGFYIGKLILGIGFIMLIPLTVSLFNSEWNPAIDFVIGSSFAFIVGYVLQITCRTKKDLGLTHGVLVVPIAWLAAMFFGAVPLYLSGHFGSFLDSMFEAMSGFATTGLSLTQDLDHLSYGHNFWRHLTMFIGGQGIVVVVLTLMAGGSAGIYGMYVGEAREEKIVPNLIHTARTIWMITFLFFGIGVASLWAAGWFIGIPSLKALFHGVTVFMAAFDTGGFTPQSQSFVYYHSPIYELVAIPIMVAGGINFALHYALFLGNRREMFKNTEVKSFAATILLTFAITAIALSQVDAYDSALAIFRRGFFHIISAHTGTGFMTVYGSQFPELWGSLAMTGLIVAMGLGATMGSTAGGIKALRIVVAVKAFILEAKRLILPSSAVVVEKYHHLKGTTITDKLLLNAFIIGCAYITTYFVGAVFGIFFGNSFADAMFESVSAAGNVGLTSGITSPGMPDLLKIVYIVEMWAGRLEFISIVALLGFAISMVRGK